MKLQPGDVFKARSGEVLIYKCISHNMALFEVYDVNANRLGAKDDFLGVSIEDLIDFIEGLK